MGLTVTNREDAASRADALERLVDATGPDMARVNALILSRADSHVEMVPELAHYLIEAGGKRLRPMLTLASADLFGGGTGDQISFAAAVEFMHNATLLHDDVVDESTMRRGKPAARMVWGNAASVLVGDFLLGQAFLMMVETGNLPALNVLSRAAAVIAEGEVFQLAKSGDLTTTADDYMQVIEAKTATLFSAATTVGAMAGNAEDASVAAMTSYGRELGLAFQLVDDVLDYGGVSGTMGKNRGDDLREGKMTLPVILALESANAADRSAIASALGKADCDEDGMADVVEIFDRLGVLQQTVAKAEAHAATAVAALRVLPASPLRSLLSDTAEFCVARAY